LVKLIYDFIIFYYNARNIVKNTLRKFNNAKKMTNTIYKNYIITIYNMNLLKNHFYRSFTTEKKGIPTF